MDDLALLELIRIKTEQGKIEWKGSYSIQHATIPGTNMTIELEAHDDPREEDWYTLTVSVSGSSFLVEGKRHELAELIKMILGNPKRVAMNEAREILESL